MPRGKNPEFLQQQYQAADVEGELAKIPLSVKFPIEVDRAIRNIPNYSQKVRAWVIAGLNQQTEIQSPEQELSKLDEAIVRTLFSIPPKERKLAQKYFQKLKKQMTTLS